MVWDEFPNFKRWQQAMLNRGSIKKAASVIADKEVKSKGRV
jgi:hypothetical protein